MGEEEAEAGGRAMEGERGMYIRWCYALWSARCRYLRRCEEIERRDASS